MDELCAKLDENLIKKYEKEGHFITKKVENECQIKAFYIYKYLQMGLGEKGVL